MQAEERISEIAGLSNYLLQSVRKVAIFSKWTTCQLFKLSFDLWKCVWFLNETINKVICCARRSSPVYQDHFDRSLICLGVKGNESYLRVIKRVNHNERIEDNPVKTRICRLSCSDWNYHVVVAFKHVSDSLSG